MQTPHAKKLNNADLYSFDSASTAADIVASTYNKLSAASSLNPFADYVDAPLLPPPTASAFRPPTSAFGQPLQQPDGARPMTAVKGAGYNSSKAASAAPTPFDPLGLSATAAPPLVPRNITSPELQCKELEKHIHKLLEESAAAMHDASPNLPLALEKAKEAVKRERALNKQREKYALLDTVNHDLSYAILFNLANTYARCGQVAEALNTYQLIIRNKQYPHAQRLRVNVGNLYFAQGEYTQAVKAYRMCLDHLAAIGMREVRGRVMSNVAVCFLKLGQYHDAIHTLEAIMDAAIIDKTVKEAAGGGAAGGGGRGSVAGGAGGLVGCGDVQTGFNLVVCYYALGDKDKMKKGFAGMLQLDEARELREEEEEEDDEDELLAKLTTDVGNDSKKAETTPAASAAQLLSYTDELTLQRKERQKRTQRYLILAARLIAPYIEGSVAAGFDWVIEQLRKPKVSPSAAATGSGLDAYGGFASHQLNELDASRPGYPVSAMHVLLAKGISYLHANNLPAAIEVFRSFHSSTGAPASSASSALSSSSLIDHAATNLSFLYFLEHDTAMAEQYAEQALRHDRYNAKALVNKANILFSQLDYTNSKELYLEAIGVEADCVEAIYNLGVVNKRMGALPDAVQAFRKLHRLVPDDTGVVWQLGHTYELMGDADSARDYYHQLVTAVPSDPALLAHLGDMYASAQDETNAYHQYSDSHALLPTSVSVLSWLGVWCVKNEMWDEAVGYFESADAVEGAWDVKWRLMIASCWRRMGDRDKARRMYELVYRQDDSSVEAAKYLQHMAREDGREAEAEQWANAMRRIEQGKAGTERERASSNAQSAKLKPAEPMEEEQKVRGPSVSPVSSPKAGGGGGGKGGGGRAVLDTSFTHELGPEEKRQTINQGRAGGDEGDEWGDGGLDDDLLPL